jgi:hypothetical protein
MAALEIDHRTIPPASRPAIIVPTREKKFATEPVEPPPIRADGRAFAVMRYHHHPAPGGLARVATLARTQGTRQPTAKNFSAAQTECKFRRRRGMIVERVEARLAADEIGQSPS